MSPDLRQDVQALLRELPLPSYIYSLADGNVLGANEAFCTLLGYPMEEMRAKYAPHLYAQTVRKDMERLMRTLPPEGTGDRCFQTRDGQVICATVRYRNSDFMDARREFIPTRLVVVISSAPQAGATTAQPGKLAGDDE